MERKMALYKVFVVTADTMAEMGKIAHSLGNRHLPAQFQDGKMLLQYDERIEEILKSAHIEYKLDEVSLEVAFRDIDSDHIH